MPTIISYQCPTPHHDITSVGVQYGSHSEYLIFFSFSSELWFSFSLSSFFVSLSFCSLTFIFIFYFTVHRVPCIFVLWTNKNTGLIWLLTILGFFCLINHEYLIFFREMEGVFIQGYIFLKITMYSSTYSTMGPVLYPPTNTRPDP